MKTLLYFFIRNYYLYFTNKTLYISMFGDMEIGEYYTTSSNRTIKYLGKNIFLL